MADLDVQQVVLDGLWIGPSQPPQAIAAPKPVTKAAVNDPKVSELLRQAAAAGAAGDHARAQTCLEQVVDLAPDHAFAQYNLGILYRDQNLAFQAERAFRRALKADPDMINAYQALGDLVFHAKHLLSAIAYYEMALRRSPNRLPILHNLAKSRMMMKQAPDVEALCRRILDIDDQSCDAHWQLAWSLSVQAKDLEFALECAEKGLALQPSSGHCLAIREQILSQLGRREEAEKAWEQVMALATEEWQPHKQICEIYGWIGEFQKSREISSAYIDRHPDNGDAFKELSTLMMAEGDFAESQEFLDRALAKNPDSQVLQMVKGLNAFRLGRFREGLQLYHARWGRDSFDKPWDIPVPDWNGTDKLDKPLIVFSEQGIGDYVMFGLLYPELRSRAKSVAIEVNVRMHSLFHRTFPDMTLIDRRNLPENWDPARYGGKVAMGDLPLLLDADFENLPNKTGFLIPNPLHARQLRDKYRALFPGKRLIGISWRSGSRDSATIRSIDLSLMEKLLRREDCAFISLQYGDNTRDLADLEHQTGLKIHWDKSVDPMGDLDPFTAQIAAMDLIISVDNSTVHFAGALGKPCWVMLPVSSDWRWLTDRTKSIWYQSLDLMRQQRGEGWEPLIERVVERFEQTSQQELDDLTAAMCRRCGAEALRFGRYADAEQFFRWLLELQRFTDEAVHGVGLVALASGKSQDAVGILNRAVELAPNRVDYHADLAIALNEAGDGAAAERLARDLTRKSDDRAGLLAMGRILAQQNRPDEATDFYARILRANAEDVEARLRLADLQALQGNYDLAKTNYARVLGTAPNNPQAHAGLGAIALRRGERDQGFAGHAWRFGEQPGELPQHLALVSSDDRPSPWSGGKLRRRRLYLRAEGTLFEQIFLARVLPEIQPEARSIYAECDPRLKDLLSQSFPKIEFAAAVSPKPKDLVERRIQLFSSLGVLAQQYPIASSSPWLTADQPQAEAYRKDYIDCFPGRRLVGITWRKTGGNTNDLARLKQLVPLLLREDLGLVSLQPGKVEDVLKAFVIAAGRDLIYDPRIAEGGFGAMVAQVAAVDLVVTTDDVVAALAGAMGKPCWKVAGSAEHWSWAEAGEQSSWHPGINIVRVAEEDETGLAALAEML